jgi:hypothetical protein
VGFALNGERCKTVIESQGVAHRVVVEVDRCAGRPR